VSALRAEPFRAFFPLGVALGTVGVGHWLLYTTGVTASYSCLAHGLAQTQAFVIAFAVGFLFTALPRRTQTPPPAWWELAAAAVLLATTATAAMAERWIAAESAYLGLAALLVRFALVRFLARTAGRRPPAAFVLVPIAFAQGVAGAALILAWAAGAASADALALGRLLVEQGVGLSLVAGVGSLVLPLVGGTPPPADLGTSPRETARAVAFGAAGALLVATLLAEHAGWLRAGPLVRGAVVAAVLVPAGRLWRGPARPGLHRRFVWLAAWLVPVGLVAAGLAPDYRVPALHVLFVGGFGLLSFGVATHVSLGHLGLERLATGRPPAVAAVGAGLLLAMAARVVADWSDTYFAHLGWAAGLWLGASVVWLAFFGPRLLGRPPSR
jgi:uncharacterized protein involved in response to NO